MYEHRTLIIQFKFPRYKCNLVHNCRKGKGKRLQPAERRPTIQQEFVVVFFLERENFPTVFRFHFQVFETQISLTAVVLCPKIVSKTNHCPKDLKFMVTKSSVEVARSRHWVCGEGEGRCGGGCRVQEGKDDADDG